MSRTPARVATSRACLVICQLTLTGNLSILVILAVKQCHYLDQLDPSLTGLISIVWVWVACAGQLAMLMQQPWVESGEKLINARQNCQVFFEVV